MGEKFPTLRDILLKYLDAMPENVGREDHLKGLPRTYMGLPVDMSNLDEPIKGYVVKGGAASSHEG
jgi:hypothetical protein